MVVIRCYPLEGLHLKSTVVEIRCFYYLNSNIITIKNNSRIIIKREEHFRQVNVASKDLVSTLGQCRLIECHIFIAITNKVRSNKMIAIS